MTHDILQSDIDLARKLLGAGRPADEIVAALSYRGIDSNRAAQLVTDLQSGRLVEPDKPIKINISSNPPPRETIGSEPQSLPRTIVPTERSERSRPDHRRTSAFPWFTTIALASAAVCVAAFVILSRKSHRAGSAEQSQAGEKSTAPSLMSSQSGSRPRLDPKSLSVEVEPAGLRLCGKQVHREDLLAAIFKILGAPTRTNQVEKVDQIIYAYDACGLLVYSPKDSGNYSIVLDFDASDGAAGTKDAFVGTFKVNNQNVRANTDAGSLALIKELGLQPPASASGIFRAQYAGLELMFGYLKGPERLSLIEIDFKK